MNKLEQLVKELAATYDAGLDVRFEIDRLTALSKTHVLVPREPSKAMVAAGWEVHSGRNGAGETPVTDCYKAMLRAAEGDE